MARSRRIGRVFAVLLLVWTTIDLCDFNVCSHRHQSIWLPALADTADIGAPEHAPAGSRHHHQPPSPADPGDCFCCSPYVDVRVPFKLVLTYTVVWTVPDEVVFLPNVPRPQLYHPPLA